MSPTHLPPNWRQRLLAMLTGHGWLTGQFSPQALRLLTAWQQAEGGDASWNALNTTLKLPGSSGYNSAGVQNYPRPVDGCCATAMTLANGYYPGILGDLQTGVKTAEQIVTDRETEFRKWGTNPSVIASVLATIP